MEQTGEIDVARFNALRQALFSAGSAELQRWAEDVLGESLAEAADGDASALASLLLGRCRERSAVDALYDAVARERMALRHAATSRPRVAPQSVASSLGPYVLGERLGQGNSSSVFAARRGGELLRLRVRSAQSGSRRSAWQRFVRVARASSKLAQLGLPTLLDAGTYDGFDVVAHRLYDGVTVATRLAEAGPRRLEEAWPLLAGVLDALQALHDAGLAHGSLHEHNVLIWGSGNALLLDPGSHFLRARQPERAISPHALASLAPELLRGEDPSAQSDLYAFGVLLYRLLAGEGPFAGVPRGELFAAQLGQSPDPLSFVARKARSLDGLDELGLALLDKDPRQRPQRAAHVRQRLLELTQASAVMPSSLTAHELDDRTQALLDEPTNLVAAAVLEASVEMGADAARVADAFLLAADQLDGQAGTAPHHARLNLHAAALYELGGQARSAARAYRAVLAQEPRNETARSELARVLRENGHHGELVELSLDQLELESDPERRARLLEGMAELLENELGDGEQALLAYVQALAADPGSDHAAAGIERLAGNDTARWSEALEGLQEALSVREPRLCVRVGKWCQKHLLRPDAALAWFQAALECDPCDTEALLAAAVLLEGPLGKSAPARELYGRLFAANPADEEACRGLVRLSDPVGAIDTLQRHAAATEGAARRTALCEAARLTEEGLADTGRAIRFAEEALAEAPDELETLRQLEALYRRARRPDALWTNLERQLELAPSPRQNVEVLLKLAVFAEQELLDGARAVLLLEDALLIEPDHLPALRTLLRLQQYVDREPEHQARALVHFQRLLTHVPEDEAALRVVANLAGKLGQGRRSADALEALARLSREPNRRGALWLAAARELEGCGELLAAEQRYHDALELEPRTTEAWAGLRRIALARNDVTTAIKLAVRELGCTTSPLAKARTYVELAKLQLRVDGGALPAEATARHALELDEGSAEAHVVLADCALEAGRLAEARQHYARALSQADVLGDAELGRVQAGYASCLSGLAAEAEALVAAEACAEHCQDPATLLRAIDVMIRHGRSERALTLCRALSSNDELDLELRARALCGAGEALTRLGDIAQAIDTFAGAAALVPADTSALEGLARLHRERHDWALLVDTLEALSARTQGEARWRFLAEAGELAASQLRDTARATRLFELVLAEHPHDHRVLVDLLGLYGENERWSELLPVIDALTRSLPTPEQSVPHLLTLARILDEKLNRPKEALAQLRRALELAPADALVVERALRLAKATRETALSEALYGRLVELSLQSGQKRRAVKLLEECYQLVSDQGDADKVLALCERAHAIDPGNKHFTEELTRRYRADPARHLERAVELQRERLRLDPSRREAYEALFGLYAGSGQRDAAWCVAQAMVLMNFGEPAAEELFRKHAPRLPAAFSAALTAADWQNLVCHAEADAAISEVFAIVEGAVRRARGSSPAKLGLKPQLCIDPSAHEQGLVGELKRLALVLGIPLPELYLNKTQKRAVTLVRSSEPCLVLGPAALADDLPPLQVAFTAASHLLHFKPGFGLRYLLATARALKVTFLAALKLGAPELPIAAELTGATEENIDVLRRVLEPAARIRLSELVAGLLGRDHALDLNRWLHGVDLTSDRLGFIASGDLATALQLVRSADEHGSSAPRGERCRELVRYAVDPGYIALRARLGLTLPTQSAKAPRVTG